MRMIRRNSLALVGSALAMSLFLLAGWAAAQVPNGDFEDDGDTRDGLPPTGWVSVATSDTAAGATTASA